MASAIKRLSLQLKPRSAGNQPSYECRSVVATHFNLMELAREGPSVVVDRTTEEWGEELQELPPSSGDGCQFSAYPFCANSDIKAYWSYL